MHKAEPDGTPIFSDWVENDDGSPGDSVVKNSPANAGDVGYTHLMWLRLAWGVNP